ncbi:hypothetical protein SCP_0901720 [Sparassis crispa]|uniref:CUE domain-containing protein n=1 Tax=Sparassis crispa TaxID=139825 RepID=A0A401GVS9_9APHY|nr:hypothetical protein SCP_0901720 [Sparassis crispa]GBE86293.1 hypothetical protein SCP_0901720 [Sparassis crispa]
MSDPPTENTSPSESERVNGDLRASETGKPSTADSGTTSPFLNPTAATSHPAADTHASDITLPEDHTPDLPPRVPDMPTPVEAVQEEEPPQIAALRSMFPDFDSLVFQSVLESVNYDQDRAIDVLLGMSDPEYVSTSQATAPTQPDLTLDEQLARQLALEDQQQPRRPASGHSWPRRNQVPYQPRQQHPRSPPQQQQQQQEGYVTGNERGDFQEFQDTFSRIAESGKRTFSSIVSKAKAKINEYQQGRPSQTSPPLTQPQWGSAPPNQPDRHTAQQAYTQEYYGYDHSAYPVSPQEQPHVQGYDAGPVPYSNIPPRSAPIAAPTPVVPPPNVNPNITSPSNQPSSSVSPRPSGDTPRPPPTMSGSPINAAKLGLLPKRTVNLLNSQPSTTQAPQVQPAAARRPSEDLEYMENPFEEGRD